MVSRILKYSAVLLVCFAALGITRSAVVGAGSTPRTISRMIQCGAFRPDGYFYVKGAAPEGFEDFGHIELLTVDPIMTFDPIQRLTSHSGVRRPPSDSRLYTKDGKSYKFTKFAEFERHSSGWGDVFEFETEMIEGVSYQFTGKFTRPCVFSQDERGSKKVVAEGRIAKFRDSKEAATAKVQFTYSWAGQIVLYPREAGDIIAFVETFSRVDLFVNDAIRYLGTNPVPADLKQGRILLLPFLSDQTMIKKAVLDIFESKPDRVNIEYSEPILISYGELVKKYGSPSRLRPPVFKCKPGVDCQPAFVGYSFSFVPDQENMTSGKRLEVVVDLKMKSSKEVPQHTDKDFLAVKEIRFRRVWRGK